jgi:hypothetical protein
VGGGVFDGVELVRRKIENGCLHVSLGLQPLGLIQMFSLSL